MTARIQRAGIANRRDASVRKAAYETTGKAFDVSEAEAAVGLLGCSAQEQLSCR
jgi:hypothetical protein